MHITGTFRLAAQNGSYSLNRKILSAFRSQTTGGIKTNFARVISTIPSSAHNRHVPLRCIKCPQELKIEKSCQAFTSQTVGWISTKLYRSDQKHP
jgi:hypothetical protein